MLLPINDYFQKSLDSSKPIIMNIIDFFNEHVNNDEEPFYYTFEIYLKIFLLYQNEVFYFCNTLSYFG